LAIDATSLVGHQNWIFSTFSLVDILPSNLEELTLFVKVKNPVVTEMLFDNNFFCLSFLTMLRDARNKLPRLRKIRIELSRDPFLRRRHNVPEDIVIDMAKFEEAKVLCVQGGIEMDIGVAIECNENLVREAYF
jgi:hypothetical protein